ncbi:MAG: LssY C-terminal domain-containing protein [Patescibacteria group bacterium]|nr:LssY C-terminal domain-containing protein [Patescibacteria group bacterium]
MEFLTSLLPKIQHLGALGYWIVLLISLAESLPFIGLIIPGAILAGLFGFFSAQGYLDIGNLILFSAIGAILGDNISYYLGTRGTKLFRQENKILKLSHLESGERFFKKHGNKSIFLGRFIGPLRPIIPFVAGLFRMDRKAFLFWNIISGVLWAISFLLLGYFFGGALNAIGIWSSRVGLFVLAVVISVIIIRILVKYAPPFFAFLKSISLSIKEAFILNPDIKNFIVKHPILSNFVRNRLNKERFSGLSLTLLGVAFVYVLVLFFGIIENIITSDVIVAADTRVANLLAAFRDVELIRIFTWITLLGKWQIIISSAIVLSAILWLWRKRLYLLPFWVTIVGSELFNSLGKLAFHRARPGVAFYAEDTFSFPSGHATISVAFYGFLAYILFRQIKKWKYKINALFFGIVIILAIGLSRLYLGVHFLSDVWGGYLLGALWLLIGISISEWLRRRKPSPSFTPAQQAKVFASILILAEIIFYVNFALRYNPPVVRQETTNVFVVANVLREFSDKNIPRFTETLIGDTQEPLSFIVIAENDQKIFGAMRKAGWYRADTATFASVAKLAKSAILNKNYPTAPMTPSFWNAKVHDFGFEKPTETQSVRERHHARFWRTPFEMQNGRRVYIGTASEDVGLKWFITHMIKPDIDTERELLFSDLENTGFILNFAKKKFVEPTLGKNFSGDQFFTDGEVYIINLK